MGKKQLLSLAIRLRHKQRDGFRLNAWKSSQNISVVIDPFASSPQVRSCNAVPSGGFSSTIDWNAGFNAVFVKDRAGRYLLFNPAAAGFVGRTIEDVLDYDDTRLFGP